MIAIRITPRFTLWSEGNGASYTLTQSENGADVHFQGDDALIFERELEDTERAAPDRSTDDILAALWFIYA